MTSYFSGADPKAQSKTLVNRAQAGTEINGFVQSNFSTVSPGTPVCACAFGSSQSEVNAATALFATSPIATQNSETVGEAGALHFLKQTLSAQGIPYDPNNLFTFSGANAFNMVYFDAAPPNATKAIIVEAKGGNSALGSRKGANGVGRVKQGTRPYVNAVTQAMQLSPSADRQLVGNQLDALKANTATSPNILYMGVATKYDKSKKSVHNPVPIFATKI